MIAFDELLHGLAFLARLPGFLRRTLTPEQAREIVRRRLAGREADFLALARSAIFRNPASPYRDLLAHAGCEYGDLARLVTRDGLEGALRHLYRAGVYLTLEEFRGRRPVVRGGTTIVVDPVVLRNPRARIHLLTQSGGSGGRTMPVPVQLASVRDRAVNDCLALDARGGTGWAKALWGVPGRVVIAALRFASFGRPLDRLFLLVDPAERTLHPRYRWSLRAMRIGGALTRRPLPAPEWVPLADPLPVARWMTGVLREGGTPHLFTFVSAALRMTQAAREAELDLAGARLTITGEPITAGRRRLLEEAGIDVAPDYGSAECGGTISYGCLAPEAPDEVHFFRDLHGLIQADAGMTAKDLPPGALLVTSLRDTYPLILLNASMGDHARVTERACGCPLERLGWTPHLDTVRSFEKLTAGGMTFFDTDVIRALDEVLPERFGGRPTDFQLAEEQETGEPRLRLLVHPAVGPVDDAEVARTFLDAIGKGSGAERVMALHWAMAGLLRVERRAPISTPGGKILHLHRSADRA